MTYTKNPRHVYRDASSGRWRIVCRDGSTEYFYRAVMAAHLGRELLATEHVHHINGDPSDDRIENLQVLDIREHAALHQPEAVAGRRAARKFAWSRDHAACIRCGTSDDPHFCIGKCRRCYHRDYMRRRRAAEATA